MITRTTKDLRLTAKEVLYDPAMLVKVTKEMLAGHQAKPVKIKGDVVIGGYIYYFVGHCLDLETLNCVEV